MFEKTRRSAILVIELLEQATVVRVFGLDGDS